MMRQRIFERSARFRCNKLFFADEEEVVASESKKRESKVV